MIRELLIKDRKNMPLDWWGEAKSLSRKKKISFSPGLNVIVGPNGCGKSTILRTMARILHCEQGGFQLVTSTSLTKMFESARAFTDVYKDGAEVINSGCPTAYFDVESTPGMDRGQFDWDLGSLGLKTLQNKGSSGQMTLQKLNRIIGDRPPDIEWKLKYDHVNDLWQGRMDKVKEALVPTEGVAKGPVIMLDEPERSLDTLNQIYSWKAYVPGMIKSGVQVIIATHSLMAYEAEGVNFVDLGAGYHKKCQAAIADPQKAIEDYVKMAREREKKMRREHA